MLPTVKGPSISVSEIWISLALSWWVMSNMSYIQESWVDLAHFGPAKADIGGLG